jgi:argininosuccinate lyase
MSKTWGGRFTGDRVEAFTESISTDRRLYHHDIRAGQADSGSGRGAADGSHHEALF